MHLRIGVMPSEKYQPSYDCTVLTEVPLDNAIVNNKRPANLMLQSKQQQQQQQHGTGSTPGGGGGDMGVHSNITAPNSVQSVTSPGGPHTMQDQGPSFDHETSSNRSSNASPVSVGANIVRQVVKETTAPEVAAWLRASRFGNYMRFFANYTGADLLTLSREELIQICGLADGIRLNNALQVKTVRPRLTIYVNIQTESVFHVLYLSALTCQELIEKLANLFNASPSVIVDVHLLGANKIHILVSDEVVQNMPDCSQYTVEVLKMPISEENAEQYRVLLSRTDTP